MKFTLLIISGVLLSILIESTSVNAQTLSYIWADKEMVRQNYAKAIPHLLNVVKSNYEQSDVLDVDSRLAECYRLINDPVNAEIWFLKIVDKNVEPIIYFYYAQTLQKNGKFDLAKKWYKKYSETVPDKVEFLSMANFNIADFSKNSSQYTITLMPFNSNYADYSPAMCNDSVVFVSSRDSTDKHSGRNNQSFYDLYFTLRDSIGKYSKPNKLSSYINTLYHEGPMSFSSDRKIIWFTRNNERFGKKGKSTESERTLMLFKAQRVGQSWCCEEAFPYNSKEFSTAHPSLSADGKKLYFASNRPGTIGGSDIWVSELKNGLWAEPQNLGPKINTVSNEFFPYYSTDSILYFASEGRPGLGGLDIYYTWPSLSNVKEIRNMGIPVNSTGDDFGLIFEKGRGYYNSNRKSSFGDDNIYEITRNIPPVAINDTFYVSISKKELDKTSVFDVTGNDSDEDGTLEYFELKDTLQLDHIKITDKAHLGYKPKSFTKGIDSIPYRVYDNSGLYADAKVYVHLMVMNPPEAATDRLFVLKGSKGKEINLLANDRDPDNDLDFKSVKILKPARYADSVSVSLGKMFYKPNKDFLGQDTVIYLVSDMRGLSDIDTCFIRTQVLFMGIPLAEGQEMSLTILYDLGKSNIRPDAAAILDSVVFYLNLYPSMEIEMGSHTDARGSTTANQELSQKRAKSAVDYIGSKGIETRRLAAKGYGESRLVNQCKDGVKCSEKEHSLNRRTTVKVTRL